MNSFNFSGQNQDPEIVRENFNKIARYLTAADACVLSLQSQSANISSLGANASIRTFTVFLRSDTDACDVTIPDPALFDFSVIGKKDTIFFFKGLSGDGTKTVNINTGTVEGETSFTLANGQTVCIQSDGTEYKKLFDSASMTGGSGDTVDTNFANTDLTFTGTRTHDLNGNFLIIQSGGSSNQLLVLHPSTGEQYFSLLVNDDSGSGYAGLFGSAFTDEYAIGMEVNNGTNNPSVYINAIDNIGNYIAGTHVFRGAMRFVDYTGAGTHVGTAVKLLAVDNAGNVIENAIGVAASALVPNLLIFTTTPTPSGVLASPNAFITALQSLGDNPNVAISNWSMSTLGGVDVIQISIVGLEVIPANMFHSNTEIYGFVELGAFIGQGTTIGDDAFHSATNLRFFISNNFGFSANTGNTVFAGTSSLEAVYMPFWDTTGADVNLFNSSSVNTILCLNRGDAIRKIERNNGFIANIVANTPETYWDAPDFNTTIPNGTTIANFKNITGPHTYTLPTGVKILGDKMVLMNGTAFDVTYSSTFLKDGVNTSSTLAANRTQTLLYDGTNWNQVSLFDNS